MPFIMLFTNCQFIEGLDISPVVPHMAIDLEEALQSGIIPGDGVTPEFNGIEELDSVVGRVRDNFDAVEHQRLLNHSMSVYTEQMALNAANAAANKSTETAE